MKFKLFAVFIILLSGQTWALSTAFRFAQITPKDGLSQATVLDILQDRQGFMWFATQDGLNRYDGYDFVVYRKKQTDPNSLSENYVNSIFQDSRDQLWLTTRNGLNRFDPQTNTFTRYLYDFHNPNSLSADWTFGANEDEKGRIWVGTYESGLNVLDPKTGNFTQYRKTPGDENSLSDNGIYDIFIDNTGITWIATRNGGVNRYNLDTNNFTRFVHDPNDKSSISHNRVYKISQHSNGTLWFATRGGGLNRFDAKTQSFHRYRHDPNNPDSISSDHVWSIIEDHKGNLMVGTFSEGLNLFDVHTDKFVRIKHDSTSKDSLSGNSVISSFVDNTGIFWFGVRDVGLNRLNLDISMFNHHRHSATDPNTLNDNSVQAFLQDRNGDVLISTREGGINRYDPKTGRFSLLHQPDNKAHNVLTKPINNVLEDKNGDIWYALKNHGLVRLTVKTNEVTQYLHDPNDPTTISSDSVNVMQLDNNGDIWLGTRNGLNRFSPKTGKSVIYSHDPNTNSTLSNNWVSYLLLDHQNQLWVGTQNGLDRYDAKQNSFVHYQHKSDQSSSLSSNSVMSMFEDSHNNLWVSTTSGLNKLNPEDGTFTRLQQEQGLSNDQVYGVLEDYSGFLWIVTNYGLNHYDPVSGEIKLYTEQDGLQHNEFNQGAYLKLNDGRLMFGGLNGFNLFDPKSIKENPFPPKVILTNFRIFNQPVPVGVFTHQGEEQAFLEKSINLTSVMTLTYHESVFSFEFSALHFGAPTRNQYAYRLVGFDKQWTETDYKNRRATYTNLAAGQYTFEVKASNKDSVWSPSPASVEITISSPWWLTTGAKFLWLGLTFAAMAILFRVKTSRIQVQKSQLQLQVTRQVAQVVAQKQALERSYNDIRIISSIGQKINASLDLEKVLWSVYEHINQLMDGTVFGIGLYQPEKNVIHVELAMEKGNRYKPYYRSMENKNQFPVWCIENDEVVFINDLEFDGRKYLECHEYDEYEKNRVYLEDGAYAGPPQSIIYVPIRSSDKVLGFITVQSFNKHAYQEVHIDILNMLAAYTGTAIVNSTEHRRLLDSRKESIESEKMASLGMLVAGVAHEINTPVGICVTTASTLEFEAHQIFDAKEKGRLTGQKFSEFRDKINKSLQLLQNNLKKTSELIADFKDVVVNPSIEVQSLFNVKALLHETLQTLKSDLNNKKIKLDFLCDDAFEIHSCASSLSRVVNTLVMNSLMHAFEDKHRGKISIFVTMDGSDLQIRYIDNGVGMDEKLVGRIFDPFYTTKRSDGCLGLGMHMVYNQVTQGLHGTVRCDSAVEKGMQIYISIPIKNS
jgi:ligand-binding sensor domain-containing protein/signal transduction histidine kinase